MLKFRGAKFFRQRVVLSTLTGKSIKIEEIRSLDEQPGLRDFEASLLRLLEKVTNGCSVEINETGTVLRYKPGLISGGSNVTHDCGTSRSIGYFLEALVCLAPFAKKPLSITLTGVTNDDQDLSVDVIRTVLLPNLRHFGIDEGVELKIQKRGAPPLGGGSVLFKCPVVRSLRPVQLLDNGKIKRIRGIAYSTRMSPQTGNRMVDSARSLLNKFIPDVYIYTDHFKGTDSGRSPGYALSLVAESTTGVLLSAEKAGTPGTTPEDIGLVAAKLLFEEVRKGGCVDTPNQPIMLLLMALCPEDVSKMRVGKLSQNTIEWLRHLKQFLGVTYKLVPDASTATIVVSCLGTGFTNIARSVS